MLVVRPANRCRRHEKRHRREKETQPHRAVYHDTRWDRARQHRLAMVGHRCEAVDDGQRCSVRHTTGTPLHGHHHPLGVRALLQRLLDPFNPQRFVMVCAQHHGVAEHEGHNLLFIGETVGAQGGRGERATAI